MIQGQKDASFGWGNAIQMTRQTKTKWGQIYHTRWIGFGNKLQRLETYDCAFLEPLALPPDLPPPVILMDWCGLKSWENWCFGRRKWLESLACVGLVGRVLWLMEKCDEVGKKECRRGMCELSSFRVRALRNHGSATGIQSMLIGTFWASPKMDGNTRAALTHRCRGVQRC